MNPFRNRPKDNYIFEAEWEALYVLTEHWKSNLYFYKDDIRFLQHFIHKYFIWILKSENIDLVRVTEISLIKTNNQCTSLLQRTIKHLLHLTDLIDAPFKYDSHKFRKEHEILENDISSFVKLFKQHKKETFLVTEKIMNDEALAIKN